MTAKFLSSLALILLPAFAHSAVTLKLDSSASITAGATMVSFDLVDDSGKSLTPSDLNVTHEKKLHFIAYDPGLKEFQHVHPEFDGQAWTVDMNFSVDGNYFVWAQGETSADSDEFTAGSRIVVTGGQAAWPAPQLTDIRQGDLTGSVATLSNTKLRAGQMAMLMLTFTKTDGSPADITPYLGAFAHIIATPETGDSLIHIHPMDGNQPNEGMVHVTFPTSGNYRLWVQFIDAGVLKTIPLSVSVK